MKAHSPTMNPWEIHYQGGVYSNILNDFMQLPKKKTQKKTTFAQFVLLLIFKTEAFSSYFQQAHGYNHLPELSIS